MSRDGFFASWAAVDTASNPMYAKNMTPAPRRIAAPAELAERAVFGGMNGVRLARFDVRRAGDDEDDEHRDLDDDEHGVRVGRFLDPDHEQRRDDEHDRRRPGDSTAADRASDAGMSTPDVVHEADEVARPADGDRRRR